MRKTLVEYCFAVTGSIFALLGTLAPMHGQDYAAVLSAEYANAGKYDTLRVDYSWEDTALVPRGALYEHWNILDTPKVTARLIVGDDVMYYRTETTARKTDQVLRWLKKHGEPAGTEGSIDELPFELIESALAAIKPDVEERVIAYDGNRVIEKSPYTVEEYGRQYKVFYLRDTGGLWGRFPVNLLDRIGFSYHTPGLEADERFRARYKMDVIVKSSSATVLPEQSADHGPVLRVAMPPVCVSRCDRDYGYAVVQRDFLIDKRVESRITCDDFRRVGSRAWLPHTVSEVLYGDSRMPESLRGKPVIERVYRVKAVARDSRGDMQIVRLAPSVGAKVIDERVSSASKVPGESIVPAVSYTQPADENDIDAAIADARVPKPVATFSPGRLTLFWMTVAILAILLGLRFAKNRAGT